MSIDRWMIKEAVVHIQNGVLLSRKKNEMESVVMMWMNLETVTQRKVSQKEKKQILYINTYIYTESIDRTNATDRPVCQAGIMVQT